MAKKKLHDPGPFRFYPSPQEIDTMGLLYADEFEKAFQNENLKDQMTTKSIYFSGFSHGVKYILKKVRLYEKAILQELEKVKNEKKIQDQSKKQSRRNKGI